MLLKEIFYPCRLLQKLQNGSTIYKWLQIQNDKKQFQELGGVISYYLQYNLLKILHMLQEFVVSARSEVCVHG